MGPVNGTSGVDATEDHKERVFGLLHSAWAG